jgi:biopolymer transport protein ExbB/TolQ
MADTQSDASLRDELKDLEEQIAELRRSAQEIRTRIGGGWDAPTDEVEIASALTHAEEQEAFIRALEERRDRLLERLRHA